jgi:hypothetical protein
MAQMYEVQYTTHFPHVIDTGKVLVCANSQEMAADAAVVMLELPRSSTQCVVNRIRPAVYIIERREIDKTPKPKIKGGVMATIGPVFTKFHLLIEGVFSARTEEHALRKLTTALNDKLARKKDMIVPDLKIEIFQFGGERSQARASAMERVETYRPKSFVGGIRAKPER